MANKLIPMMLAGLLATSLHAQETAQPQQTAPERTAQKTESQAVSLPPAPSETARASGAYLDEIIRLEAAIERLNKQAALKDAERKLVGDDTLPFVSAIIIDRDGPSAKVTYPTGLVRTLRQGDIVGEGKKVVSITSNGVLVSKGKSQTYLPFQAATPSAAAGAAGSQAPVIR